jgi:ABC-type branched-subunit amino acid transport system permease subunit
LWIGVWLAMFACIALGAFLGALAFRSGISGVYFTLLTIAFAEFARIGFDHFAWVGGSGGLFLKVGPQNNIDWLNLRGPPAMYYYVMLTLAALAFGLSAWLLHRRPGYYWQAIRENEEAASALGIDSFHWKILAVVTSAAMTAVAGVFLAFYYNNLFPEQIFSINRSVEIILGPIIGGMGTLFGPIIGAALMTLLDRAGWSAPSAGTTGRQTNHGLILFAVWCSAPWHMAVIARKLNWSVNLLEVEARKSFWLRRGGIVQRAGLHRRAHRPQWRRQNDAVQSHCRRAVPDSGPYLLPAPELTACDPIRFAPAVLAGPFRSSNPSPDCPCSTMSSSARCSNHRRT